MAVIDELKKASYRFIPFFYQSTSESGGFKVAEHLYPGSDNFRIEQLGKVPRRFSIQAKVQKDNRDRLDNALNTPGTGLLSHPMYGNFLVKVTTFTKDDAIDSLGFYTYNLEFVVEIGLLVPTIQGVSLSLINKLKSQVWEQVTVFVNNNTTLSTIKTETGT